MTETITAFTEDRGREWVLTPRFEEGFSGKVIVLYGPHVAYYVDGLKELLESEGDKWRNFCIDAMGRNFGTKEGDSVYVDGKELLEFLRERGVEPETNQASNAITGTGTGKDRTETRDEDSS